LWGGGGWGWLVCEDWQVNVHCTLPLGNKAEEKSVKVNILLHPQGFTDTPMQQENN